MVLPHENHNVAANFRSYKSLVEKFLQKLRFSTNVSSEKLIAGFQILVTFWGAGDFTFVSTLDHIALRENSGHILD